ncbi:MAG TPA: acyltransferase family protein [Clostridiales bacterium]|nr:acyltransferase family protein [Clostridiales bacterium]
MKTENARLGYVDFIKGFGIILVVIGHATIPRSEWIYSFHVPLFFFISGYVNKERTFFENLRSKLSSIYFPFVIFNILTWIFFFIITLLKGDITNSSNKVNLFRTIIGFENSVPQNGPLWFLLCLFTVSIIYSILCILKNEYLKFLLVVCVGTGGYFLSELYTDLPFKIETAMVMLFFFYTGSIISKTGISAKIDNIPLIHVLNISFALSFLHYLLNAWNISSSGIERVSVLENRYGTVLLFFLSAFAAVSYIFILSKKIDNIRSINFLGENSLLILCFHYPVLQYIERIHPAFLSDNFFLDFISSGLTIALCIPLIYLSKTVFRLILKQ